MLQRDAAPGIHRIEDAYTNWYLVEGEGGLTVVDAGVPSSWGSLTVGLRELGRSAEDVRAVVLTHAHFDHLGLAERARRLLRIGVWVHEDDVPLTRHPLQYAHERGRLPYLANPAAAPIVGALLARRAFWPQPVADVRRFTNGTLPVPGSPRVVRTPGHTLGHCAFHFPERDAVVCGDAVVTLDPYTGARGPRLVACAATADVARNLDSLDALAATGARIVLPGHGVPWTAGAESAVAAARAAGSA